MKRLFVLMLFFVIGLTIFFFFLGEEKGEVKEKEGYVTFWFDDGLLSTYQTAYPVLEERDWRGVLAVVGRRALMKEKIREENDQLMTWGEVERLESAGWEVSSHSMTHSDFEKVDDEYYLKMEIVGSKEILESHGFNIYSFTFPYGMKNIDMTGEMVEENYDYWRSTVSKINCIPPERHLGVFFLTECAERETVKEWIRETEEDGGWLIIVFHSVIENPVGWWQQTPEQFMEVVELIEESSLEVVLPKEIFEKYEEE